MPDGTPAHVVIGSHGRAPRFGDPDVAVPIVRALRRHPATLCACLMPDHLHWLIDDASRMSEHVCGFKSATTRRAARGQLWQRSFWDRVVRSDEDLERLARYILANPVRAGLVRCAEEYGYSVIRPERLRSRL